jgi:hypothetical protein
MNQIENTLYEFKNDFEQMYNDTVNHMLETKTQKDEINNKLNVQMKEQFAKIYELINEEEQTSNNSQIERIKSIQNLIRNLLKNVKILSVLILMLLFIKSKKDKKDQQFKKNFRKGSSLKLNLSIDKL